MAANVAHYTATLETKPSIFDLIAQKSLNEVLYPACRKFALFLANTSPRKFGWLSQYYDEVFLLLNGILQEHYVRNTGASFSEYFYGLERISSGGRLTDTEKRLSLVFLVVLPYIKRKVDERVQLYRLESADGVLRKDFVGQCKRLLIVLYTSYQVLCHTISFVQYLSYMSNMSEYPSVSLRLLKLKLVYVTLQMQPGFWVPLLKGQLSFPDFKRGFVEHTVRSILELSAFFVQFLKAFNTERSNYSFSSLPFVPPPSLDNKASNYKGLCPLCLQRWKIPTVLPVSGSDSAPTITKIDALQTVNDAKNRIRELHRKLTGRDEDSHIDAIKKKFRELSQRDGRPFHKLSKVYDNPDRMFKRPKFLNSRHGAIGGSIIAKPAANEEDLQKRTTDRVVQPKHLY
ncbi:hypothetical protein FQA39_LY14318 [Lamprigera yunnana]|nr:hypothetical protein FQA39_LY14318 [Lamprigera yunnana]